MESARVTFGKRPVAFTGLSLAIAWIGLNVWEWYIHSRYGAQLGWYTRLTQVVDASAVGVVGVAALVWIGSVIVYFADRWRRQGEYVQLLGGVDLATAGVIILAALLWLYEALLETG